MGRRDEIPNIELAKRIAAAGNGLAVKELIEALSSKNKDVQNDSIKVLYETGALSPSLIVPYFSEFVSLLRHKNNRLQWGAMTALEAITLQIPKRIKEALPEVLAAAESGSVITRDYAVAILIKLCSLSDSKEDAFPLLIEQLYKSPTNQLPMYAEKSLEIADAQNKRLFQKVLVDRLPDIEQESKKKRIEKVIGKLGKLK